MTMEELIELAAQAIYHKRYKEINDIFERKHLPWTIEGDHHSDLCLAEHERDEYRYEAMAVIDIFIAHYNDIEKLIIKNIIE